MFTTGVDTNTFEHYFIKETKMLIRPLKKKFYIPSEDPEQPPKKKEFLLSDWFFNENAIVCKPDCDPSKPRLFKKKGQRYINISLALFFK